MKRELAGDDFEFTPYRTDLEKMLTEAGFDLESVELRGLDGVRIRARRPSA